MAFPNFTNKFFLKRTVNILRGVLLFFLVLLTSVYITVHVPVVQEKISHRIASVLSHEWQTTVKVGRIRFNLFNQFSIQELLVNDRMGDTLAYVGELSIQTSDFFFLQDSIAIKKIDLQQAKLYLQREDSNWRHQFLLDYFKPTQQVTSATSKPRFRLHLEEAALESIEFIQTDCWQGQRVTGSIKKMKVKAAPLNLGAPWIHIKELSIEQPTLSLATFKGNNPTSSSTIAAHENWWRIDGKKISIDSLAISQGKLKIDQNSFLPKIGFDPHHLEISQLQASLHNSWMSGDTLQSHLTLSAREKSGFFLQKLEGLFQLSPHQLSINNFELRTPNSVIRESLRLQFEKLSDLKKFEQKVTIHANFNQSIISSEDLTFFAPSLRHWKKSIRIGGILDGTLQNWQVRSLSLASGASSYLQGHLSVKGLPAYDKTHFALSVQRSNISWEDLSKFFTASQDKQLAKFASLRYLRFNGQVEGNSQQFQLKGHTQTHLGALQTSLKLDLPATGLSQYQGQLQLNQFKLGELIGLSNLEEVNFSGRVKGSGWGEQNSVAHFDGTIESALFNHYRYQQINWNATLQQQSLTAAASIDNDGIKTGLLKATIDWSGKSVHYAVEGLVEKADLQALHFTETPLVLRGNIEADAAGTSLTTLEGLLRLHDINLWHHNELLPLDSITISAKTNGATRRIEMSTNECQAWLAGQFNWTDLPLVYQDILHTYYPSRIAKPTNELGTSSFQFECKTQNVEPFFALFSPQLTGLNQSVLKGELDGTAKKFSINLTVPSAGFQSYKSDSLLIQVTGDAHQYQLNASAKAIALNEAITLPPLTLRLIGHQDSTQVILQSVAQKQIERINLNALVRTFQDGIAIDFASSDFTLNGKSWTLDPGGSISLQKNKPAQGYLKLAEGEQEIAIKTINPSATAGDALQLSIKKLNLNDIAPYFLPANRLEGLVSGEFLIKDPLGDLSINSSKISAELLRLDNDSIGSLQSDLVFDGKTRTLKATGSTLNQKEYLGFNLSLHLDSLQAANRIDLNARTYPIRILERFLGDLFSDMNGYLTGDVSILGDLNKPSVIGKGRLKDAGLRINYTQCYYKIEDKDVELTTSLIDLDGMVLRDTVTGNPIYVTGGIKHESFDNLFYELNISTRKPGSRLNTDNKPVQLLKTTLADNSLFYGDVKGTAQLQLKGPASDMVMSLNVTASEKDSSYFTLPPGYSRESGMADFLVERRYGTEMTGERKNTSGDNILYDVELTANPLVALKVQLDELTGDEIKGNGAGTFKIRSGTTEPLSLRGRFDITSGNYLFTFQSFFKKPFEIKKGGVNYIEWTGDPYDANIKFEALYKAERVSFSPLASTLNLTSEVSNARSDVYVVARLSDKLFKPVIDFYLDFPANSIANSNPELGLLLKQLQQNTNELNRQVTYLIVFNSFAPNELGGTLTATGVNVNTISGLLLSVVSDQINKLFNNLLKSDKYRINLNTSLYNRNILSGNNPTLSLGSNVNFSIGRSFFNNRFTIATGLGMDAPLGQNQTTSLQQSILLLPDVTMEWLVNPSGTVRVSFFYRTNADYLSAGSTATAARARRTGGSLSYKREFDRLGDFFKRKRPKKSTN